MKLVGSSRLLSSTVIMATLAMATSTFSQDLATKVESLPSITQSWDKTFKQSHKVEHKKVTFKNRFGIDIVADIYYPKNAKGRLPALVLSGPFGAVKEQVSGMYAQTMAERGYLTLAFDPSFTGESGGAVRNVASPEIFTEDFGAAIDYLGLQNNVDRNRIGILAICGLSGMGITAAATDTRVKAVVVSAMYDMSRSITKGYLDSYTPEQQEKIKDYLSNQRWEDASNGRFDIGLHEIIFDEKGNLIPVKTGLPDQLPANANPILSRFWEYYKQPDRGYHKRSINSTSAWSTTTPVSFFNFNLMDNIERLKQPLMLVTGENAHSKYYSEDVYKLAKNVKTKTLVVVPNADHVDLYDNMKKIPFATIDTFFQENLQ